MASVSSKLDISKLISELKSLEDNVPTDEALRKELYATLRDASLAVEAPLESVKRIGFSPLQLAVSKVAADLDLFGILDRSQALSSSTMELAHATGSNPNLLVRLLRYLAGLSIIHEVAEEQFAASNITRGLAQPGLQAGLVHSFDSLLPCWQALPGFLASSKYENPTDNAHCAFQIAHHTELPAFIWALSQPPARAKTFSLWMQAGRTGQPTWLDVVPFQELCQNKDPEKVIFVDIGGSIGHQCAALKARYPDITGRIIYQDIPPVIAHGLSIPGVEPIIHDFWTEQPVKGASIYYLRNIMHDYPDDKCVVLLKNTMAAMDNESVIWIDELILSNHNTYYQAAEMDINMMLTLAGAERTEKQWRALLNAAGLTIRKVYTYTEEMRDSIIVAVRKYAD